jgi:hypothetical protein
MNHWETHLYTYAVALQQGTKIRLVNLEGMRAKAIRFGHTEGECQFVEQHTQLYISTGKLVVTRHGGQARDTQTLDVPPTFAGATK